MITKLIAAAGVVAALACGEAAAEPAEHVLRGRVMDTSDNWLPDVRVELKRMGVETRTDGNGLFELRFTTLGPLVPDAGGTVEILELTKEKYRGRLVRITDAAYFAGPVEEKMAPDPVATDTVGFVALMPANGSIHGLVRGLEAAAPHAFTAGQLRERLARVAAHARVPEGEARFYAWVPEKTRRLKAAFLISLHGMGTIDHPVLRRFAEECDLALVGVEGPPVQRGCYPVSLLDPYLVRLGELTGHPELAEVPVFTFGHSNGTGFATVYAVDRAERLIGWISYHSGYAWQLLLPGVENAPGLVMHGHLDNWLENGQEQAVKDLRRSRNAPVAMMLEGNVGHGAVDTAATWAFIVEFCKAAMRIRLADDGTLRPVAVETGWLGGAYDRAVGGQQRLAVAPYAGFTGDRATANWFPDRAFAETWQAYGSTNPRH